MKRYLIDRQNLKERNLIERIGQISFVALMLTSLAVPCYNSYKNSKDIQTSSQHEVVSDTLNHDHYENGLYNLIK